jgi:hypothetical protein
VVFPVPLLPVIKMTRLGLMMDGSSLRICKVLDIVMCKCTRECVNYSLLSKQNNHILVITPRQQN